MDNWVRSFLKHWRKEVKSRQPIKKLIMDDIDDIELPNDVNFHIIGYDSYGNAIYRLKKEV